MHGALRSSGKDWAWPQACSPVWIQVKVPYESLQLLLNAGLTGPIVLLRCSGACQQIGQELGIALSILSQKVESAGHDHRTALQQTNLSCTCLLAPIAIEYGVHNVVYTLQQPMLHGQCL